jgi:hypothetical protein
MKTLPFVLFAALAAAACGGSIGVDPITRGAAAPPPNGTGNGEGEEPAPEPVAPIAPYTGDVGTNDVSILYPMPAAGESAAFVRPTDSGTHGELLPKALFDAVLGNHPSLERTNSSHPSGYSELALISLRLDPCSARKGKGTCTSEVRAVFQAVYEKNADDLVNEPGAGHAAQDGALHVMYELGEAELVVMMKQILTLRKAQGDLTSARLEVHPILAKQGLGGAFATGLRDILLEHVGGDRVARITMFDHNFNPDSDGWMFEIFDRVGGAMQRAKIPTLDREMSIVAGTSAVQGPFSVTGIFGFALDTKIDRVQPLVEQERPAKGSPEVTTVLEPAFAAALRVQNPKLHDAETTDCANCHLAEGAFRHGKADYGFDTADAFTAAGGTAYLDERVSATNLHAFGYLGRKVSIMQRTANESTVVRDWMDQKVK